MLGAFGVRAWDPEPDRRAILRLAHHLPEGILLYRNFKENPQQSGGFF
jgi:hypothetical protein